VVPTHRAFIRIRATYVLGGDDDAHVLPEDYEPLMELERVTQIALKLSRLQGVLCYFNPNGEVLLSKEELEATLATAAKEQRLPIEAWSNVRLVQPEEWEGWALVDSVGMAQLDVADHEACFDLSRYNVNDVVLLVRNLCLYTLDSKAEFHAGEITDGPGGVAWKTRGTVEPIMPAPREIVRWVPIDDGAAPEGV
jgi:hypothetical protein